MFVKGVIMSQNELEKIAYSIFEEDVFLELKEWYSDVLGSGCTYVVFNANHSYVLALILECITGKKIQSDERIHYLTDASVLLHCNEIAEIYRRNHYIPSILLCNDVCIHGRSINQFIEMIEKRLIFLLPDYDERDVKEALLNSLNIHVYARLDKPLLLSGKYEFNLNFKRKVDAKFMNKFLGDISMLISYSGIANTSYVYSEIITNDKFSDVILDDYIETTYQNVTQYTYIKFVGNNNAKKGVFTLRIIKYSNKEYMIIPYVFMPNLGAEETNDILCMIEKKMYDKNIPKKYVARLRELRKISGMRSFNEIVVLLFSHALLQEFNHKYSVAESGDEKKSEVYKLARNYNQYGFEDTVEWLESILSVRLFKLKDIEDILESTIMPERKMVYISNDNRRSVSQEDKKKIKEKIEKYFYTRGCEEEKELYELSKSINVFARKYTENKYRGCGFLLWDINHGYTEIEAKYSISYFLQMIDSGIIDLSSFTSNDVNVIGMAQYVKTGNQFLMSKLLELYEWIPMLSLMEEDCGRDLGKFKSRLENYFQNSKHDFDLEKIAEIEEFVEKIYCMNQKIQDWNNWSMSFLHKLEVNLPNTEYLSQNKKISNFLNLQLKHISDYKESVY